MLTTAFQHFTALPVRTSSSSHSLSFRPRTLPHPSFPLRPVFHSTSPRVLVRSCASQPSPTSEDSASSNIDTSSTSTPGLSESFRVAAAAAANSAQPSSSSPTSSSSTPSTTSPSNLSSSTETPSATTTEKKDDDDETSSDVRQLLGMKGASSTTNKWRIRLQLMKPVTWVPLIWGVTCGAAASGNFHWNSPTDIAQSLTCMFLAGPLLTGYTQVINDWYDRHIDAINEPYRPIPSGLVTETDVKLQIGVLLSSGIVLSYILDQWAHHSWPINTTLTIFGAFIAFIYSAPPLKLKQNGWLGSYALGASYISLPWWAGQALFGTLDWKVMVLTLFYSLAGLGIAIVNDFKSVEGDRKTGMMSLPVMFGIDKAKWICVGMIDIFQLLVAAALFLEGEPTYAAGITALVLPQMFLQAKYFLKDPVKNDVKYQAAAQPFLVLGILVAGLAVGHHGPL